MNKPFVFPSGITNSGTAGSSLLSSQFISPPFNDIILCKIILENSEFKLIIQDIDLKRNK